MDVVNLLKSIKRKDRKRKTQKHFEHLFYSVKMDFGLVKKKKNTKKTTDILHVANLLKGTK